MFKKFLILTFAILLLVGMANNAEALYGLEKYWAAIYDSEGNVKTDITSVTVYDVNTATVATVYSNDTGTSLTNPITTGLSDGIFEFYTSATSVDVLISDGVRAKKISGMTTTSPHRILFIDQAKQLNVVRFMPTEFMNFSYGSTNNAITVLSAATTPGFEENNELLSLVWSDGEVSYVQVTFKVPDDYLSGGAFKALVDYNTGSDNPEIDYYVLATTPGSAWDTSYTAQTAVDPAGTAGSPELVTLPITTDFASLAAGDIVMFAIGRNDEEASTADLELYYVEFYYDSKE